MSDAISFLAPRADVLVRRSQIVGDLIDLLPPECLVHEARELVPFETDAFVSYRRLPLAVALPRSTAEVATVMKYCHRYGIPVVPRGADRRGGRLGSRDGCDARRYRRDRPPPRRQDGS